jgi:hypothetical protein
LEFRFVHVGWRLVVFSVVREGTAAFSSRFQRVLGWRLLGAAGGSPEARDANHHGPAEEPSGAALLRTTDPRPLCDARTVCAHQTTPPVLATAGYGLVGAMCDVGGCALGILVLLQGTLAATGISKLR